MVPYQLSPYVATIENRLTRGTVQSALFHRLSGEIVKISAELQQLLGVLRVQKIIRLDLSGLRAQSTPTLLLSLIDSHFFVPTDEDALTPFLEHYVVRPIQNPAIGYRRESEEVTVIRTSMAEYIFGRRKNDLPVVIEESVVNLAGAIFRSADGTNTLREIILQWGAEAIGNDVRDAVDFLTSIERQLIKLTPRQEDCLNPYHPCNIIGRNLVHANEVSDVHESESVHEFHLHGIEDGTWEFDQIEPTINHAFRFPSEVLQGLNYGAKFCSVLDELHVFQPSPISILEVGGGTGTFAHCFIEESLRRGHKITYHILDLSPTLIDHQKSVLSDLDVPVTHFHQDATQFDIPGQCFDLIISNEVIADFPVAQVAREGSSSAWNGPGQAWVEKYDLQTPDDRDQFLVNSGVFKFLERAHKHLNRGGFLIATEYGWENIHPVQAFQLNHEEFSIHFGNVKRCAESLGFECRLEPLKEFLHADDQVLMLDGRELRILCLNHIFRRNGIPPLPYAALSKTEFASRYEHVLPKLDLIGLSYSPLAGGFHFTPDLDAFMTIILRQP